MRPLPISTSRLNLRSAMEGDAKNLFAHYCSNIDSSRYLTRPPHKEIYQTKQFLTKWCDIAWKVDSPEFAWVVALKNTNEAIGVFLVEREEHRAQIHYGISSNFSDQGLITEAGLAIVSWLLAQKSIQRIWTVCDLENHSSIRVLNKLGFKNEGILQKWLSLPAFGQTARDCYIYGLTK